MRLSRGVLVAAGLALVLGACGDHPTAPGSGSAGGSGSGAVNPKVVSSLRISGPSSIAPGATGRFTAIADYTDGSSADVTATASWQSSNPSALSLPSGGSGTATARNRGEAVVTAIFQKASPGVRVLVLEPGTFKLSGSVTESGSPLVFSASVEVIDGIGAGLKAFTNVSGRYALYGVAGNIRLRVSSSGFIPAIREAVVGDNDAVSDVSLVPEATAVDLKGKWTTTLTAASECSDKLSEDARVRVFDTTVMQAGQQVQLTMENTSTGLVARVSNVMRDKRLTLEFWKYSYYGEPGHLLFERLAFNRWLGIEGTVEATFTGPEIRSQFKGEFVTYTDLTFRSAVITGACESSGHGFTMRRQ